jgi:hypothetical protein
MDKKPVKKPPVKKPVKKAPVKKPVKKTTQKQKQKQTVKVVVNVGKDGKEEKKQPQVRNSNPQLVMYAPPPNIFTRENIPPQKETPAGFRQSERNEPVYTMPSIPRPTRMPFMNEPVRQPNFAPEETSTVEILPDYRVEEPDDISVGMEIPDTEEEIVNDLTFDPYQENSGIIDEFNEKTGKTDYIQTQTPSYDMTIYNPTPNNYIEDIPPMEESNYQSMVLTRIEQPVSRQIFKVPEPSYQMDFLPQEPSRSIITYPSEVQTMIDMFNFEPATESLYSMVTGASNSQPLRPIEKVEEIVKKTRQPYPLYEEARQKLKTVYKPKKTYTYESLRGTEKGDIITIMERNGLPIETELGRVKLKKDLIKDLLQYATYADII